MLERILAVQIPQFVFILFYRYLYYEICLQTSNQDNETIKQVAWVGFWGPAQFLFFGLFSVCKYFFLTFAHGKRTKKQKLKIATMALEWVPVIYLGVISLDSKFQLNRSSDN